MVKATTVNSAVSQNDIQEHRMTVQELCNRLGTDAVFGLTRKDADMLLHRDGKNLIVPIRRGLAFFRFLSHMFCIVCLLFWTSALNCIACFITFEIVTDERSYSILSLFIFSVFYAIFIGTYFYAQSKYVNFSKTVSSMSQKTEVIREGQRMFIPSEDVVVGDLILLKFGERIPADVRIIETQNFKVDNHTLTGEPDLVNEGKSMLNSNIALMSGTVVEGTARGIVIRTGRNTFIGQIIGSREVRDIFNCPIVKKVIDCLNTSSLLAAFLGLIFFGIFLCTSKGVRISDALMVWVTTAMATVPETLFPAILIALHIFGPKVFLEEGKLKNFRAIQKLPFVKTICLDKPGVLTQNKVLVSHLWFDGKKVEVWAGSKVPRKERGSSTFRELGMCAVLCIEAELKEKIDGVKGEIPENSDDVAILKFLGSTLGKRMEGLREAYPKLLSGSYAKFQLSVNRMEDEILVILIGEPEFLLEKCSSYATIGSSEPIDEEFMEKLDKACVQFAKDGESLKCVIEKKIIHKEETFDVHQFQIPESNYTFVGLFTLSDSPKPNVAQTIAKCREGGIKIILTTRDHPIMAKTFARSIGIITEGSRTAEESMEETGGSEKRQVNAIVVDGMQLTKLSKRGIRKLINNYSEVVFARASLIQKMMVVETCQQENSMVAVVGDGIHDSLTMKQADLSVTVSTGAKDSVDVVADVSLTDETFYSLATSIEEGRTLYQNLKKSSAYLLGGVIPLVVPIAAYSVIGIPLPLNLSGFTVAQLLLELLPAVALMFEKPEQETMQRPPIKLNDSIWPRQMIFYACGQIGVIETFACFFAYFIIMLEYGWTPFALIGIRDSWESEYVTDLEDSYGQRWTYQARQDLQEHSQTGYFFAFISVQCANLLECRHQWEPLLKTKERNWIVHFSMLLGISLTFLIIYIPYVNVFTRMKPLKPAWWVLPIPFFCLILLYDESKKYYTRRHPKGWLARETIY